MPLKLYVIGLEQSYYITSTSHQYYDLLEDDLESAILSNICQLQNAINHSCLVSNKVKTINFLGYNWSKSKTGGQEYQWKLLVNFKVLLSVHTALDEPKIKRHINSNAFYEILENWFKSLNLGEVEPYRNTGINSLLSYTSYYQSLEE